MYIRLTLFFLLSCIAITYAKPTAEITSPKAKNDALGCPVASFRPETILTVRGMAHTDGKAAKRSFDLLDGKGAVVHSLRDVLTGTDEYLPAVTHDGVLAKLDLSVVRNGIYALRMSVEAEGVTETTEVPIAVCGMNKIGAFRWKSRDLTLKVGKESLTLFRRYDSMDTVHVRRRRNRVSPQRRSRSDRHHRSSEVPILRESAVRPQHRKDRRRVACPLDRPLRFAWSQPKQVGQTEEERQG